MRKKIRAAGAFGCLLAGAAVFTADRLLKASIERQPDESFPREVQGTNGLLRYEKSHNRGFAMGAFAGQSELVKTVPVISAAVLCGSLGTLFGVRGRTLEKAGLSVLLGGAFSNICDRFSRGYVVDYLSIRRGVLSKIAFNLGDLAILAGSVTVLFGRLFEHARELFSGL